MMEMMMRFGNALNTLANGEGAASASEVSTDIPFWQKIFIFFIKAIKVIGNALIDIFYNLMFLIARLVLNVVDFLAIAVKELSGQTTVADITSNKSLRESDLVFNFLYNNDVRLIFRSFLAIGIVLIIVFAIVAVVKKEYDAFLNGDEDNNKRAVVVRMLTSLFLVIIVPLIVFAGIIFSNSLLTSVNRALTGSNYDDTTFASQIFAASTYESNQYRLYADKNARVPITFEFGTVSASELALPSTDGATNQQMEESMLKYLQKGALAKGIITWWQFMHDDFVEFNNVDVGWKAAYDKNIQTSRMDYYVMADVVDYMLRVRNTLCVVNAYDLLQQGAFYIAEDANYSAGALQPGTGAWPVKYDAAKKVYSFRVYYNAGYATRDIEISNQDSNGRFYKEFTFNETRDESTGAVYLLCNSSWVKDANGRKVQKFSFFKNFEKEVNKYNANFYSDYLLPNQIVVARGCFDKDGYPTAIREVGSSIEYYRENVVSPSLIDIFPRITYEKEDGNVNLAGGLNKVVELVTGLDLSDLIPKVYFRDDLFHLFTKRDTVVAELSSKEMYLDFNFANGIPLYGVESIRDLNVIVLMFGSILLVSVLFSAVFGLVSRIFDLVLLFITYPVFAATLPLDGNTRFKMWTEKFIGKLFGAYSIVIGLDLVFILIPAINEMGPLFSVEFVSRNVKGWSLSAEGLTTLMNYGVWTMFYLVAFSLFKTVSAFFNEIFFNGAEDIVKTGSDNVADVKKMVKKAGDVVSGRIIIDKAKSLAGFVPGAGFFTDKMSKEGRKARKEMNKNSLDIARRQRTMRYGSTEDIMKMNKGKK